MTRGLALAGPGAVVYSLGVPGRVALPSARKASQQASAGASAPCRAAGCFDARRVRDVGAWVPRTVPGDGRVLGAPADRRRTGAGREALAALVALGVVACGAAIVTPGPPAAVGGSARTGVPNASAGAAISGASSAPLGPPGKGVVGPDGVQRFATLAPVDRERLRSARLFFGHQSVGANLIDGARALGYSFRPVAGELDFAAPVRGEAYVGENHDPLGKIRSFTEMLQGRRIGARADAAAMKLCFVDYGEGFDLGPLERAYAEAVDRLTARYPHLRLYHVTTPLSHGSPGDNRVRLAFGAWMKERYGANAVVFDLQAVESTRPDGTRCQGGGVPELCDEYREDDGHLSPSGAVHVAQAWLYAIARTLGAP